MAESAANVPNSSPDLIVIKLSSKALMNGNLGDRVLFNPVSLLGEGTPPSEASAPPRIYTKIQMTSTPLLSNKDRKNMSSLANGSSETASTCQLGPCGAMSCVNLVVLGQPQLDRVLTLPRILQHSWSLFTLMPYFAIIIPGKAYQAECRSVMVGPSSTGIIRPSTI